MWICVWDPRPFLKPSCGILARLKLSSPADRHSEPLCHSSSSSLVLSKARVPTPSWAEAAVQYWRVWGQSETPVFTCCYSTADRCFPFGATCGSPKTASCLISLSDQKESRTGSHTDTAVALGRVSRPTSSSLAACGLEPLNLRIPLLSG